MAAAVAADARALLVLEALHRESAVLIHLTQVRPPSSGPVQPQRIAWEAGDLLLHLMDKLGTAACNRP